MTSMMDICSVMIPVNLSEYGPDGRPWKTESQRGHGAAFLDPVGDWSRCARTRRKHTWWGGQSASMFCVRQIYQGLVPKTLCIFLLSSSLPVVANTCPDSGLSSPLGKQLDGHCPDSLLFIHHTPHHTRFFYL